MAKLSTFFETLTKAGTDDALSKERVLYQEMKLASATDKTHFKYLEHQSEPLSDVSGVQQTYIDEILERCSETLPITTNLFKSTAE